MARLRYSLRALLVVTAVCAVGALLIRVYSRSESPFLIVQMSEGEALVYLDDRPLGVAPVTLSYSEFMAAVQGKARLESASEPPEFGIATWGARIENVRNLDGTQPMLWIGSIEGYRSIGTPFGPATLVHTIIQHPLPLGTPPQVVQLTPIVQRDTDAELRVVQRSSGGLHGEVLVHETQEQISQEPVEADFYVRSNITSRPESVNVRLAPQSWRRVGDRFIATFALPELAAGAYWIDGTLVLAEDTRVVPAENIFRGRLFVAPAYFVVDR